MAMALLRLEPSGAARLVTAGMPAIWIHRAATGEVEEWLTPAPPLATLRDHVYEVAETTLEPGDTALMMTDGAPESRSADQREPLGYDALRKGFAGIAHAELESILAVLFTTVAAWTAGSAPEDDASFIVVRRATA